MLTNIEINNFRCLRAVDVPLKPLTVLIGPNDTGKSVFLAAVQHIHNPGMNASDFWMGDNRIASLIAARTGRHSVRVVPRGSEGDAQQVRADIGSPALFSLPSKGCPMQATGQPETDANPPTLGQEGQNIAALVDYFLRRDRGRFDAFVEAIRGRVPGLKDIHIATPSASERRIDLVLGDNFVIPADGTSAGVRLLLFFVAMTYHPSPPKLILLEEPENGMHPKRLENVVKLLRDITLGVHCGHPAQVILTTHSPYLLDYIDIEKDQVLVFSRQKDGSCSAKPASPERLKDFLQDFKLGEIWYNKEEEGLVG